MGYGNKKAQDFLRGFFVSALILAGWMERIGNWMWFSLF